MTAKVTRRRFTTDYKRKIVREADGCKTPGAVGALLRREGLYSSHLTTWRAARERGALAGPTAVKKRGPTSVSNDNPFSESQFRTLKYRPAFPERFGSIQDARAHCHVFFPWYNTEHHHSGLGLLTPYDVHHGLAEQRVAARAAVLTMAYAAHPERFPAGPPHPPARPMAVWINPPKIPAPLQTLSAIPPSPLAHAGAFA